MFLILLLIKMIKLKITGIIQNHRVKIIITNNRITNKTNIIIEIIITNIIIIVITNKINNIIINFIIKLIIIINNFKTKIDHINNNNINKIINIIIFSSNDSLFKTINESQIKIDHNLFIVFFQYMLYK